MNTVFFAARKIHQTYFSKLANLLPDSEVIYYKHLFLPSFCAIPFYKIKQIVKLHLDEKKNSVKRRHASALYWKIFTFIKQLEASWLYLVYKRGLIKAEAKKLIIWNGLKYRQMIVVAAAESLSADCIFMENGLLPGFTTLDPQGVNFLNSAPRNADFYRSYKSLKKNDYLESYNSALEQNHIEKEHPPEVLPDSYVFIPFQVNTDSQITRFSPWIKDMYGLVDKLAETAHLLGNKSPTFVFKTHPACPENYDALASKYKKNSSIRILIDNALTTQQLIQHADAVITINSTVGIESLLIDKKVIILGQAFYNIEGMTLEAQSVEELAQALLSIDNWQPELHLRDNFFRYLAHEYQVPGRWQESTPEHLNETVNRIEQLRDI